MHCLNIKRNFIYFSVSLGLWCKKNPHKLNLGKAPTKAETGPRPSLVLVIDLMVSSSGFWLRVSGFFKFFPVISWIFVPDTVS